MGNLFMEVGSPIPFAEERLAKVIEVAEMLGLRGKNFTSVQVRLIGEEKFGEKGCWDIVFDAFYRSPYLSDGPGNLCILSIYVNVRGGKCSDGWFHIWDQNVARFIARNIKTLPYPELVSVVKRAQGLGLLHRDLRPTWPELTGWADLLPYVECPDPE